MTDTLDRFKQFLPAGWPVGLDWLQDELDAGRLSAADALAAVLRAYAGTAARHWLDDDCLPQEGLAEWLGRQGDARAGAVAGTAEDPQAFADALAGALGGPASIVLALAEAAGRSGADHPAVKRAEAGALAACRRDRKRRTLALFPEVACKRAFRYPVVHGAPIQAVTDRAEADMAAGGEWRLDAGVSIRFEPEARVLVYRQELAAPDWIAPPDRADYGPSPLAGAWDAFQMGEAIRRALGRR